MARIRAAQGSLILAWGVTVLFCIFGTAALSQAASPAGIVPPVITAPDDSGRLALQTPGHHTAITVTKDGYPVMRTPGGQWVYLSNPAIYPHPVRYYGPPNARGRQTQVTVQLYPTYRWAPVPVYPGTSLLVVPGR